MRKKMELGDTVFGVSQKGTIVQTLVCGLHSKIYDKGEDDNRFKFCRSILPTGSAAVHISTLAGTRYAFLEYDEARSFAIKLLILNIRKTCSATERLEQSGRLKALQTNRDDLRERYTEPQETFMFDRRYHTAFSDRGLEECYVPVAKAEVLMKHQPLNTRVWLANSKNWHIENALITGVFYWAGFGHRYEVTSKKSASINEIFITKEKALDAMKVLFRTQYPGELKRSRVKVHTLNQSEVRPKDDVLTFDIFPARDQKCA